MNPNCVERRDSTVTPQALHLMNNGMVHVLTEQLALRVSREARSDSTRQVQRVYLIVLNRVPADEELKLGRESIDKLKKQWEIALTAKGKHDANSASLKALTTFCHAIVNSAAFLYVD